MLNNSPNSNIEELPRVGSALYNLIHPDEKVRIKTLRKYKRINKYVVLPLYRSGILPLLGFGRIFLILTTKGRITGKKRRTPLEYHWIDGVITIFSGRGEDAGWIKNVRANPDEVRVRHGFHFFKPHVEYVTNEKEMLSIIKWYVLNHNRSAKLLFGWNPKFDDPEKTDFSKMLKTITIIRLL
ncbi:MAG: nitroreductase family deazaflavin-dependent oxidoreductase [Promethearchaeota archaeon]